MSTSTLINGKHYKQVLIEYYDDLIAQLDIQAESTLDKFKDDEDFIKGQNQKILDQEQNVVKISDNSFDEDDFFQQEYELETLNDPSIFKYSFVDEPVVKNAHDGMLFQDFVHAERMRGINEIKQLQKDRLEELKLAKIKPTSFDEALFGGNKFGFLVEINESLFVEMRIKFRLLVVVIDFFIDMDHIEQLKELIGLDLDDGMEIDMETEGNVLDEKCLQVQLLARYLRYQILKNPNGECVKRVSKKHLYSIDKINLSLSIFSEQPMQIVAFDGSIDFHRLKSLSLCILADPLEEIQLKCLTNIEFLDLDGINFDLKRNDPFVNIDTNKLRKLCLYRCNIKNLEMDFYEKFPNLETIDFSIDASFNFLLLESLSILKNLKFLSFSIYTSFSGALKNLDFLKEITSLVNLKINGNFADAISVDTFKKLRKLDYLAIQAKKGKWLKHLTHLKSFDFYDLGIEDCEEDYFVYLSKIDKLRIKKPTYYSNIKSSEYKQLNQLNSLSLDFHIQKFGKRAFESFQSLTELEMKFGLLRTPVSLKSDPFKKLRNLRKLSITNALDIGDEDFFDNFPNLKHLRLKHIICFELSVRTFATLRCLEKLEILSCFAVDTLPENVFLNLSNLRELHIFECRLASLDNENSFNGLDNLSDLFFYSLRRSPEYFNFNMNILRKMPNLRRLILDSFLRDVVDAKLIKTQFPNLNYISFFEVFYNPNNNNNDNNN